MQANRILYNLDDSLASPQVTAPLPARGGPGGGHVQASAAGGRGAVLSSALRTHSAAARPGQVASNPIPHLSTNTPQSLF